MSPYFSAPSRSRRARLVVLPAVLCVLLPLTACHATVDRRTTVQSGDAAMSVQSDAGVQQSGVRPHAADPASVRRSFDEAMQGRSALPVMRGEGRRSLPLGGIDERAMTIFLRCDREVPAEVHLLDSPGQRIHEVSFSECEVPEAEPVSTGFHSLMYSVSPLLHDVATVEVEVPEGVRWTLELFTGPADPEAQSGQQCGD